MRLWPNVWTLTEPEDGSGAGWSQCHQEGTGNAFFSRASRITEQSRPATPSPTARRSECLLWENVPLPSGTSTPVGASRWVGGCFHHKGPDPHCCVHSILLQYFMLIISNSSPCRGGAGVTEEKGKGRRNWGSVSWLFPFSAKTVSQWLRAAQVALEAKNPPADAGDARDVGSVPTSWRRKWQPTPVFLPGESHRQRSLAAYGP